MYSTKPHIVYGFHALDKSIAFDILNQRKEFNKSQNTYDWLGHGIYFWENNYQRAVEYGVLDSQRQGSKIVEPFVLGSVIDLGNCLDLLDQRYLNIIGKTYIETEKSFKQAGRTLPENGKLGKSDFDFKNRELDCLIINLITEAAKNTHRKFDTVRAAFWEGPEAYTKAGFRKNNHIQIAVLNRNCIKGIFLPRQKEFSDHAW